MAKTAVKAKKDLKKPQHPQQRKKPAPPGPARLLLILGAAGLIALVAVIGIVLTRGSGDETTGAAAAAPLPNTSDYHSLLVAPTAPDQLVLGTHQGLFRSVDGGRSWTQAELANQDAMNLARARRARLSGLRATTSSPGVATGGAPGRTCSRAACRVSTFMASRSILGRADSGPRSPVRGSTAPTTMAPASAWPRRRSGRA